MSRSVVIVQARLGSSRLPGKVLMNLAGRTVLSHVIERCAAIPGADAVCIAVPDLAQDDPVAEEALKCGALVARGPEADVLARYAIAARESRATTVMRITSDCPVIDPEVCGQVLRLVTEGGADYACNNLPPSFPHGLDCEAFKAEWLLRAETEAELPSEREHVTPWLRNHPTLRRSVLAGPGGDTIHHRWTLDTPDDLDFLRALFAELPAGQGGWDYRVPLVIAEANPALVAINAGHDRDAGLKKSLLADRDFVAGRT
jgi:spore coat polysaccharide biosynthesis protein SpsF (cytidylyltransferase family)